VLNGFSNAEHSDGLCDGPFVLTNLTPTEAGVRNEYRDAIPNATMDVYSEKQREAVSLFRMINVVKSSRFMAYRLDIWDYPSFGMAISGLYVVMIRGSPRFLKEASVRSQHH
jgi:hypothetical protein